MQNKSHRSTYDELIFLQNGIECVRVDSDIVSNLSDRVRRNGFSVTVVSDILFIYIQHVCRRVDYQTQAHRIVPNLTQTNTKHHLVSSGSSGFLLKIRQDVNCCQKIHLLNKTYPYLCNRRYPTFHHPPTETSLMVGNS